MASLPSYSSIPSNSSTELTPLSETRPIRRRKIGRATSVIGSLALIACLGVASIMMVPTSDEMQFLREYNLPLLGSVRSIRSADQLASNYRFDLLLETGRMQKELSNIEKGGKTKQPPEDCEATVILIRHCEKGNIREHCAYVGYERSVYLATLFGDNGERWPSPSYILALAPGGRHRRQKMNFREIETVGPLASKVNVSVDYSYKEHHDNDLATEIRKFLSTGSLCGKVALISWKHSGIGHIAHRLGCGPAQGCPLDYRGHSFDDTWHLKFVYGKLAHSNHKSLKIDEEPEWRVFGSVQPEGFDPLAFSKLMGDYPPSGSDRGGRWEADVVGVPEREGNHDKNTWDKLASTADTASTKSAKDKFHKA